MNLYNKVANAFQVYRNWKDKKESKEIEIDVREMIMQQNSAEGYNRLDIAVRYLAIEEYFGKNTIGYNLYLKMQAERKKHETAQEIQARLERFRELISDWEKNGYRMESKISCDCNLNLLDGSHRLALGLYFGTFKIWCIMHHYEKKISYGLDWFIEHGFDEEEMVLIMEKVEELKLKCGGGYALILWNSVSDRFDEITKELSWKGHVEKYIDYTFKEETYGRMVKGIYAVDDIDDWKVSRKIDAMKDRENYKIRLIYFRLELPKYRIKKKNNKFISQECEQIKRIFRGRYKDSIDNYIHDIIIHIADNYEQSEYIFNLMSAKIELKDYFKTIDDYAWMVIKGESAYMPDDFPVNYPFSKDVDVICDESDYDVICEKTYIYLKNMENGIYNLKIFDEGERCRYRFELKDFLIIQLDISKSIKGIKKDFLLISLERRKERNGVFSPEISDEFCFRLNELRDYPHKEWHRKFVLEHIDEVKDSNMFNAFENYEEIKLLYEEIRREKYFNE